METRDKSFFWDSQVISSLKNYHSDIEISVWSTFLTLLLTIRSRSFLVRSNYTKIYILTPFFKYAANSPGGFAQVPICARPGNVLWITIPVSELQLQ